MKRTTWVAALAACALLVCVGCKNSADDDPAPVAVESVTLNATTLSLAPGAKGKLTATVTPDNADDKSVKWSSDNTSVASVDYYGTVKAVKVGTANITAHAGGKTATCVIKVHVHSYSNGKCTVCGFVKPSMPDGEIDDDGVLTKYTGNGATVVIPDGVTGIGEEAFSDCTSLESVTYGGTLAQWCAMDNDGCLMSYAKHVTVEGKDLKQAESIEIPDGVTYIGASAFSDCMSLASVTIPASVTGIGRGAFEGCESLTDVTYTGTLAQWCAMNNNDVYLMYYAKHVTVEGTDLKQATTLAIPDGVTGIGSNAFAFCTSLASVTIPASVTSIGEFAFRGCTSLASVAIPNSVTSIGEFAFASCTSLTSVTIPDGVTEIGIGAFAFCTSLASVTYGGTKDGWSKIEKGIGIFYDKKVTQITGKDGTFTVNISGDITE